MSDFTVGELKRALAGWPDDMRLDFFGGLTFYRMKQRAPDMVMLEFNEAQADMDADLRRANPDLLVGFLKRD